MKKKLKIKAKSNWMKGFTVAKPASDMDKVEFERLHFMPRINRKGAMNK